MTHYQWTWVRKPALMKFPREKWLKARMVKIQAIGRSKSCKPTQNKINMRLFFKVNNGIEPDTERSATESDYPYEIFTMDTDQEEMIGELHTVIEGTDGLSNLVENVHPSDISE